VEEIDMSNAQDETQNLEQRVAHLEDRLKIYEEIDEKINRHNVSSMNTFRAFLSAMSIVIALAAIILAAAAFWGTTTLFEASRILDDANRKSEELQVRITAMDGTLAETTRKVANIETDVSLSEDGSGILLGGYDVIVMNKALMDILQKKGIISEVEREQVIQTSIPKNDDGRRKERGLIYLEQTIVTDEPPIIE
jgi:hypothetical protein